MVVSEDPVPGVIFVCNDLATFNTHISRFVLETRKSNGDFYALKALHQLLWTFAYSCMQRSRELVEFIISCYFGILQAIFVNLLVA